MHIGIDVGGTNIKGVLMNSDKEVITRFKIPTKSRTSKKILLNQIFECIDLLKSRVDKVRTIGIGIASPIDFKKQSAA